MHVIYINDNLSLPFHFTFEIMKTRTKKRKKNGTCNFNYFNAQKKKKIPLINIDLSVHLRYRFFNMSIDSYFSFWFILQITFIYNNFRITLCYCLRSFPFDSCKHCELLYLFFLSPSFTPQDHFSFYKSFAYFEKSLSFLFIIDEAFFFFCVFFLGKLSARQ